MKKSFVWGFTTTGLSRMLLIKKQGIGSCKTKKENIMTDKIISHKGKTYRASTVIEQIKADIKRLAKISNPCAIEITHAEIAKSREILATVGMDENTVIKAALVAAKQSCAKPSRYMAGRSYTAMIERNGDINNLLRRNGNFAAAE